MNKLVSEESGVFKCYLSAMCFRVSKINERATSVEQKSCKIRTNSNLKCLLQSPIDAIGKSLLIYQIFPRVLPVQLSRSSRPCARVLNRWLKT